MFVGTLNLPKTVLWPSFYCLKDFPQLLLVSTREWFTFPSRSEVSMVVSVSVLMSIDLSL